MCAVESFFVSIFNAAVSHHKNKEDPLTFPLKFDPCQIITHPSDEETIRRTVELRICISLSARSV